MAKLSFRIIVVFLLFVKFVSGQDTLYVYQSKGTPILEYNEKQSVLKKGALITSNNSLVKILPKSEITIIDNKGSAYKIDIEGSYSFKNIFSFKVNQNKSNFTANYLKHIWEEFNDSGNKQTLIAGVFRGDILMTFPIDSSKIVSSKITLKWRTTENIIFYYIFLKNVLTKEILKIETNGSQIALYDDIQIFLDGSSFEWTVSSDAFPNLDNIPFYSFSLIDRDTYKQKKLEYKDLITDLKSIGSSEKDIETILCKTYGLCK